MDLGTAVQILLSEMKIELEVRDAPKLGENVTGARLYFRGEIFGAIALITDEFDNLQSCAYHGEYPGQTSVKPYFTRYNQRPLTTWAPVPDPFEERNQICLSLDTIPVPFSKEATPRLVRVDHSDVPFLGIEYDGWDARESNHLRGPAAGYARRLFEQ